MGALVTTNFYDLEDRYGTQGAVTICKLAEQLLNAGVCKVGEAVKFAIVQYNEMEGTRR